MVAFCSPAKSLTFSGLMENPLVGKKLKVLTSLGKMQQRNPSKPSTADHFFRFSGQLCQLPFLVAASFLCLQRCTGGLENEGMVCEQHPG